MKSGFDDLPDDGRIPPTPEDLAIAQRNIRRMFRWNSERPRPAVLPYRRGKTVATGRFLGALHLFCGDYLEFGNYHLDIARHNT